jgi:hypothetical protein
MYLIYSIKLVKVVGDEFVAENRKYASKIKADGREARPLKKPDDHSL